jgi:uncharacterized protein (TIGR03435 family)
VDKTGLAARYDFTLEYSRGLPQATPGLQDALPPAPDLFTAIERQLGLQLVREILPFEVLVIESVDKLPTEN